MAITWRNIGQSSNQGNSLISGAVDTITQGLGSIRNAAREVTQEQIRQYNVQGETNTADILNQIQSSNDPSRFSINQLKSQYGNQFDASSVTGAIGDRTKDLRNIARNQMQDTLAQSADTRAQAQLTLDKAKATSSISVDTQRIKEGTANLELQKSAKERQDKISEFSNTLLNSLPEYSTDKEVRNAAINKAKTLKGVDLTTAEIGTIANEVSALWNQSIGTAGLQPVFDEAKLKGAEMNAEYAKEAQRQLDIKAKTDWGLNPILMNIAEDKEVDFDKVRDYYNERAKSTESNWDWSDDESVEPLIAKLTTTLKRSPTGAELQYFASKAFNSESLDSDDIVDELNEYGAMLGNTKATELYRNTKRNILEAQRKYDSNAVSKFTKLARDQVKSNQQRFKGLEGKPLSASDLDMENSISDDLRNVQWIKDLKLISDKPKEMPILTNKYYF